MYFKDFSMCFKAFVLSSNILNKLRQMSLNLLCVYCFFLFLFVLLFIDVLSY